MILILCTLQTRWSCINIFEQAGIFEIPVLMQKKKDLFYFPFNGNDLLGNHAETKGISIMLLLYGSYDTCFWGSWTT